MVLLPDPTAVLSQAAAAQGQEHVITRTLTGPFTTIKTLVALGSTAAASPDEIRPESELYGSQKGLSGAQLGAILGSIAAAIAILVTIAVCLSSRRRRNKNKSESVYNDNNSTTEAPSVVGSFSWSAEQERYPPELIPGGAPNPTSIRKPRNPPALSRDHG
ncbi:hypothetical protein L249_6674 [Ophiocordyceps polyrhachis-furcata BCC 54312]|uniref:Mid2 domain-containing protein n=1 Tax=Ophiocordyceps polyrhachis-furcata BCC 54312 TaxID=1330021 RepID=A0A367LKT5_9HYPO|nr:hypothetical protein L249_6674 [Ophiocordyceps polyrhachis-furcata BCC 54312]